MTVTNSYCEMLGIQVPSLEVAAKSPRANTYALLIVALLERGAPLTLKEAAKRFEEAGVAPAERALASLKRCRPGRCPIHRDGERYALDPHDEETDLWAFRLGLRPPKVPTLRVVRPDAGPVPSADEPLTVAQLDEAWRDGVPGGWSAQRTAICVLDAQGPAMRPEEVLAFVRARSKWSLLKVESGDYWRRGAPIAVRDDGGWELDRTHDAVRSAREAVRDRVVMVRRWAHMRTDPVVLEATQKHLKRQRSQNAERLARMRRVIVHAFPAKAPEAVVLIDVGRREMVTLMGTEVARAAERINEYDIIAAVDVRAVLRNLGCDEGDRRLAELGPPQKTVTLNQRGRALKLTTALFVQGSCGISRPLGDEKVMRRYLEGRAMTRLRRRAEADAKSLFALYQYGRLHGAVRLRWGFLDEMFPVSWAHRDEGGLYALKQQAFDQGVALEVVVGNAPAWEDPWARGQEARVVTGEREWQRWLVDGQGLVIDDGDVQLARIPNANAVD